METEKTQNLNITSARFSERMSALIVKYYNVPTKFFSYAKKIYEENYMSWMKMEKVNTIIRLFRDGYKAYNASEREKLPTRFLDFCHGLKLDQQTFDKLFFSFWLLVRKRKESRLFLVDALKSDMFNNGVNMEFIEDFNALDSPLFRETFVEKIDEIGEYLYDSTYIFIAQNSFDQYTLYDSIIFSLMRRGKDNIIIEFLKNKNILLSKECYQSIIDYATNRQSKELLKFAYHNFLFKYSVKFKDFYTYYQLLTEEEKKTENYYLNRVVEANHLEKPFQIIQDEENNPSVLKNLTIDEFSFLSDMIMTKYEDSYSEYLLSSIERRSKMECENYLDVFSCLEKYTNLNDIFYLSSVLKEISLHDEKTRKTYLNIMLSKGLLKRVDIHSYQESKHVSD